MAESTAFNHLQYYRESILHGIFIFNSFNPLTPIIVNNQGCIEFIRLSPEQSENREIIQFLILLNRLNSRKINIDNTSQSATPSSSSNSSSSSPNSSSPSAYFNSSSFTEWINSQNEISIKENSNSHLSSSSTIDSPPSSTSFHNEITITDKKTGKEVYIPSCTSYNFVDSSML